MAVKALPLVVGDYLTDGDTLVYIIGLDEEGATVEDCRYLDTLSRLLMADLAADPVKWRVVQPATDVQ